MTKEDIVNHPKHYTSHPSGVECIQVTEHLNFNIGNAIKYLWRAGIKEAATEVVDLNKAVWYIEREIQRLATIEANKKKEMAEANSRAMPNTDLSIEKYILRGN